MNITNRLIKAAVISPSKKAVLFPKRKGRAGNYQYLSLTFEELERTSHQIAKGLTAEGIKKGDKCLLLLKPSLQFHALIFALFRLGAVPVLIDPGMGLKNLLNAIRRVRPTVLISLPIVNLLRPLFPKSFKAINHFFVDLKKLIKRGEKVRGGISPVPMGADETAAILFTSGGTGIPKGVVYTHQIFDTQVELLKKMFNLTPDHVDLPGLPLFSLFTIGMGMTSCIPDMNPSRPSKANPKKLVRNILDCKATFVAGSPAIWEKVGTYCQKNNITLPSVKYLVMFGAPVATGIHRSFAEVLPNGSTYTPYGATESLPVSNISGAFILKNTALKTWEGHGTCIGRPCEEIAVKIIKFGKRGKLEELPPNQVGEIIVKGRVVTKSYHDMPEETAKAKIIVQEQGKTELWHRMGDLGYLDGDGLLWFCGRAAHRAETSSDTLYSVQCEAIFNQHPDVKRSALISGKTRAAIVIERRDQKIPRGKNALAFKRELLRLAERYHHTAGIREIFFHKSFPVDVRHNIKIDRLKLRDLFLK